MASGIKDLAKAQSVLKDRATVPNRGAARCFETSSRAIARGRLRKSCASGRRALRDRSVCIRRRCTAFVVGW
jgi:hypothetical protein